MPITLAEYAAAKRLGVETLRGFGLREFTYMGAPAVQIPYLDEEGEVIAIRFRVSLTGDPKLVWPKNTNAKGLMYGLHRLDGHRAVTLVEGESDCHTLWTHDLVAVGLTGATMWQDDVQGITLDRCDLIHVVIEPDDGGQRLLDALGKSRLREKVRVIRLGESGDPSALHIDDPVAFQERWRQAVGDAVPISELPGKGTQRANEPGVNKDGEEDAVTVEAELQAQFGDAWDAVADLTVAELLDEIESFIRRFMFFALDHQAAALSLWVLHTHLLDAAFSTPYILITSPELRAGKTRLLEVLELLVHEPEATVDTTGPSLFRAIEEKSITLLLDEVDEYFRRRAEDQAGVRAIINSGYRRGKYVTRMSWSKQEKRWVVKRFHTFSPKALAGIDRGGQLGETLIDRSIPIRLVRKPEDEPVEIFIAPLVEPEAGPLRANLSLDESLMDELENARPLLPAVHDRAREIWWPLLAIADAAGSDWPRLAREACVALTDEQAEYGSRGGKGVELLEDIRRVFRDLDADSEDQNRDVQKLFSADLVARLIRSDGSQWDSTTMTQHRLAAMLRPYGIVPRNIRIDEKVKRGFERSHFTEVFNIWLGDSS